MTTEAMPEFGLLEDDVLDVPVSAEKAQASGEATALDELRAALAEEVVKAPIALIVPRRKNIAVSFSTDVEIERIKAWRKKNKDRHSETGVDELRFAATVVANQAIGVSINEREAYGVDGEPLSFRHPDLHSMLNASSALESVLRLYASDADVLAAADEVLKEAGYGEEAVRAEDPTTRR